MSRSLFAGLLTVALAGATTAQDAPAQDAPTHPTSTPQHALLSAGPMLGPADHRTAVVWVQTARAAEVQLRYHPADHPESARLTAPTTTEAAEDFVLSLELTELEPGVTYVYELYLDGERVVRPYPLQFTTRPLWLWRTDAPDLTLLTGSCVYVNEPIYDRPGTPYGGGYEIFETMANHPADGMLWLGDNTYLREVDFRSPSALARRYRLDRALPEMQRLLASTYNYAIWDDHDYGPNDSDRSYALKDTALEVFTRYWPAHAYGTPDTPGIFHREGLSDVGLFFLDDRYYRAPNRSADRAQDDYLGRAQLDWLKDSLVNSYATFKVIVCGNQVINTVSPYECMAQAEDEFNELISFIRDQQIEGVVFLSGDRHHSEVLRLELDGLYPLYEITSSPLTSGAHTLEPDHPEYDHPFRLEGSLIGVRNFTILRVTGARGERVLSVEFRDAADAVLYECSIPRTELSMP